MSRGRFPVFWSAGRPPEQEGKSTQLMGLLVFTGFSVESGHLHQCPDKNS